MQPIEKVNESQILGQARTLVTRGDVDGLSTLIDTLEAQRTGYLSQAQEEARLAHEAQQMQASQRGRLAYLDPQEALKSRVAQQFELELRGERLAACQQQAEVLGKLLSRLRQERERLQAQRLSQEIATEAKRLQDELDAAKANLEPLRHVVEKIIGLIRQAGRFNVQSETAKIPAPILTGDPGIVNRLQELRLEIPPELEWLAGAGDEPKAA